MILKFSLYPKHLRILLSQKEKGFQLKPADFTGWESVKLPSSASLVVLMHTQVWEQILQKGLEPGDFTIASLSVCPLTAAWFAVKLGVTVKMPWYWGAAVCSFEILPSVLVERGLLLACCWKSLTWYWAARCSSRSLLGVSPGGQPS